MTFDAVITALEHICLDGTTPSSKPPMEIGIAAKDESNEMRDEEKQRIADLGSASRTQRRATASIGTGLQRDISCATVAWMHLVEESVTRRKERRKGS